MSLPLPDNGLLACPEHIIGKHWPPLMPLPGNERHLRNKHKGVTHSQKQGAIISQACTKQIWQLFRA